MDSKTVRYSVMENVVVMIFPEAQGAKDFIGRLQTANLLQQLTKKDMPLIPAKPTLGPPLKPRVIV
jgi:hypothetical protein